MDRPLVLVGMPGSGKSTVGRRLAARLKYPFMDSDLELEARCGVTVATVFDIEGEQGFRDRESRLLAELTASGNRVIATGGGVVLREENRRLLTERAIVVYLQATLGELWNRLRHDRKRPLLQGNDPRQRLADLLVQRAALYESVATVTVRSRRQPADRFVHDMIQGLVQHNLLPPLSCSNHDQSE